MFPTFLFRTRRMQAQLCIAATILTAAATVGFAQELQITPANAVLLNDPVAITLSGFAAKQLVRVQAERVMSDSGISTLVRYRSHGIFEADQQGKIDIRTSAPQSGTYTRADARGLFWSMLPTSDAPGDLGERVIEFSAVAVDAIASPVIPNSPVAVQRLKIIDALDGIRVESVGDFPGAKFANANAAGKRAAIILLGGSEGGTLITRMAPELASRGFAVLALPYYSPPSYPANKQELPDLPAAFVDIPVERLNLARAWLQKRTDVDAKRIAVFGTSKGAEFALIAGVHLPWITSIVAYVPSDVVWEGWGENIESGKRSSFALNGKPLPFVPYEDFYQEFVGFQTGDAVRIRRPLDRGRAANPGAVAQARIPVERIKAPVLVVGGQEDQVWNSAMMAHNIAERRSAAKLDTVSLIYVDAGHMLNGSAMNPTTQYDAGPSKIGGTPQGNAAAQMDAYPKVLAFLKRTLRTP